MFDLGGGTLDLSLIESFEGIMEVSVPHCMVKPDGHHQGGERALAALLYGRA